GAGGVGAGGAGVGGPWLRRAGRPGAACVRPDPLPARPATGVAAALPASRVLGALAAAEVIRVLLAVPTTGRRQTFDLLAGTFAAAPLERPGCAACGSRAGWVASRRGASSSRA